MASSGGSWYAVRGKSRFQSSGETRAKANARYRKKK